MRVVALAIGPFSGTRAEALRGLGRPGGRSLRRVIEVVHGKGPASLDEGVAADGVPPYFRRMLMVPLFRR